MGTNDYQYLSVTRCTALIHAQNCKIVLKMLAVWMLLGICCRHQSESLQCFTRRLHWDGVHSSRAILLARVHKLQARGSGLEEVTIICGRQCTLNNSADTETVVSAHLWCMRMSYFLTGWQVAGHYPVWGWVRWGRKVQTLCVATQLGLRRWPPARHSMWLEYRPDYSILCHYLCCFFWLSNVQADLQPLTHCPFA